MKVANNVRQCLPMSLAQLKLQDSGAYVMSGVLDFDSVPLLQSQSDVLFKQAGKVEVDLSGIESANSAGLALILQWFAVAKHKNVQLGLKNIPDSLLYLARLSDLEHLLLGTTHA